MKTFTLLALLSITACAADSESALDDARIRQSPILTDTAPPSSRAVASPSARAALAPCPFVCPGTEIAPEGDHYRCVGTIGELCAAEPDCSAPGLWTLADRLDCDPARTEDGAAYLGRTNNCAVETRQGDYIPCVGGPSEPSCLSSCAGGVVTCDGEGCWCTDATGGQYGCVYAPSCASAMTGP
jgi:hypothetical protein